MSRATLFRCWPSLVVLSLAACAGADADAGAPKVHDAFHGPAALPPDPPGPHEVAIFAGGCFWSMEYDFDRMPGVISTTSGFDGGTEPTPSYEQVSSGTTGHAESVRVVYDPTKIDYAGVLDWYWHHVDPTQTDGQFCDRGPQYRTAIYTLDDDQKKAAEASKAAIEASGVLPGPIVTEITPSTTFTPAEEYHQDFHHKDPGRYEPYRYACGRDAQVARVWGQPAP